MHIPAFPYLNITPRWDWKGPTGPARPTLESDNVHSNPGINRSAFTARRRASGGPINSGELPDPVGCRAAVPLVRRHCCSLYRTASIWTLQWPPLNYLSKKTNPFTAPAGGRADGGRRRDGNEKWESGTERLIERTSHTSA